MALVVPVGWLMPHAIGHADRAPAGSWLLAAAAMVLAWLLGALLGWRLSHGRPGWVSWDGRQWHLQLASGSSPVTGWPDVSLDWGDWVLLRWYGAPAVHGMRQGTCLPLARCDSPAQWHALRVALRQSDRAAPPAAGVSA